jgi:hypothetical protein
VLQIAETVTATTPYEDLPQQLTVDEYIAVTRTSRATAYDHVRRGLVPSIRYGRIVRIPKTVLQGVSGVQDVR